MHYIHMFVLQMVLSLHFLTSAQRVELQHRLNHPPLCTSCHKHPVRKYTVSLTGQSVFSVYTCTYMIHYSRDPRMILRKFIYIHTNANLTCSFQTSFLVPACCRYIKGSSSNVRRFCNFFMRETQSM